jgi:hypothetical protein
VWLSPHRITKPPEKYLRRFSLPGTVEAVPYIDILRYGGSIPGQPEGIAVFCCPDVDTINVFQIQKIEEE